MTPSRAGGGVATVKGRLQRRWEGRGNRNRPIGQRACLLRYRARLPEVLIWYAGPPAELIDLRSVEGIQIIVRSGCRLQHPVPALLSLVVGQELVVFLAVRVVAIAPEGGRVDGNDQIDALFEEGIDLFPSGAGILSDCLGRCVRRFPPPDVPRVVRGQEGRFRQPRRGLQIEITDDQNAQPRALPSVDNAGSTAAAAAAAANAVSPVPFLHPFLRAGA